MTTLQQAARDFHPVPDLSPEDLEWWAATSAADLDARRGVSMDVEEEAPRYVVRSPEVLAEHASQWAAYQRRKADVRRWVG